MILTMLLPAVVLVSILLLGESLREDIAAEETERVIGGNDAKDGQFPWTVALYNEGEYICTGSIISETSILTAAHCVVSEGEIVSERSIYGIVGVADRNSKDGTMIGFKSIAVNPWYNEMANDAAILETTAPIEFNKNVQKICIANPKIGKLVLKKVIAMGWGQTNRDTDSPELPDTLQFANQRVVSNLKCLLLFFGNPVPSTSMCASGLLKGICGGDSGGPLVYYSGKRPIQVGISSYVNGITGCGHLLGPAAFTRISSYTAYIKDTATGDVCVA